MAARVECIQAADDPPPGAAILQQLLGFQELGSVLHVAAHPDDENTQLITFLARGRHVRTAYLSVTRGDGGQNVLGPEFGDELGLIRTNELLAARHLDGGQQFFTRAIDFGYSKDPQETLRIWDKQAVLGDVVRVIRYFQPDVIITRFSPQATQTHGHHTASAILALEAFKLAGDANAYPEQLKELAPWQPKRIFMNGGGGGRGGARGGSVQMQVDGTDPVLNMSYAEIAGRSRAMHKSQGFGNFGGGGGRGGRGGGRGESFQLLAGEPAADDIFDGIDTTWNRVGGGQAIGRLTAEVIAKFDPQKPAASVPALLELHKQLLTLPDNRRIAEKRRQLDGILKDCLGLSFQSTVEHAEVTPGETVTFHQTATVSSDVPVRWLGARYGKQTAVEGSPMDLRPKQVVVRDTKQTIPANTPLSQPYWLREPADAGIYHVQDASLIGQPVNPSAYAIEQVFDVGGEKLILTDEPVEASTKPTQATAARRLEVVAPVALSFDFEVKPFSPGKAKPVQVQVAAVRPGVGGTLRLTAPADWKVAPESQSFQLASAGQTTKLTFTVTPPQQAASADISAQAEVNGAKFDSRRVEICYEHLPPLLLQPVARLKVVALDMAIRGHRIGYVPGAGDSVAECLSEMGYEVKTLSPADLTEQGLQGLDAVVVGVRAFNVLDDLPAHLPALFAFAEAGGNVIVQYNRPNGLQTNQVAPYTLRISSDRVTDEQSPVRFLAPDHPALNAPNKITPADFDGWVQERGIYFPNQWDEHFTPLLAFNDPGEAPLEGGVLVAKHGQGNFVYTSLVWFRELPAGVPGAWRLFANLVSLGKE